MTMTQLQRVKPIVPTAAVASAGRDVIRARTNDERILALVRQWFALEGTFKPDFTDEQAIEVLDRQEKIAKTIAKTEADSMKGVASKILWLDQPGNRDTSEGYSPHEVFLSVLDDTRRIARLRH